MNLLRKSGLIIKEHESGIKFVSDRGKQLRTRCRMASRLHEQGLLDDSHRRCCINLRKGCHSWETINIILSLLGTLNCHAEIIFPAITSNKSRSPSKSETEFKRGGS